MLKNSDLRPGDTLQFVNFGDTYAAELKKIEKFINKHQGRDYYQYFIQRIYNQELLENCTGLWTGENAITEKTKTEFLKVKLQFPDKNIVGLYIQTRYFKIINRKSNHKFTKMFLGWPIIK